MNQSPSLDTPQDVAERRQFDHVRVSLPVSYSIFGEDELQRVRAVDLSNGGMRFLDSAELFRDSQISLRFYLPESDHEIVARGRIVMSFFDSSQQQYSHSVTFTRIAAADLQTIGQYIYGAQRPEVHEPTSA